MQKIGIMGLGEVGKAMAKFYDKPMIMDLTRNEFVKDMDVVHVCIPYSKTFPNAIKRLVKDYTPKLVIIHSTVTVGTTKSLNLPKVVVHSPVRGVHPNLHEGIKTFIKYVGADDVGTGIRACNHLKKLGIVCERMDKSATTELAKLLDTTYYGLAIAYHGYAEKLCKRKGLDFDDVMTRFNKSYNNGYQMLGKGNVIRPVLYPPKGNIGGHCVISNAELLHKQFGEDLIIKSILKYK